MGGFGSSSGFPAPPTSQPQQKVADPFAAMNLNPAGTGGVGGGFGGAFGGA